MIFFLHDMSLLHKHPLGFDSSFARLLCNTVLGIISPYVGQNGSMVIRDEYGQKSSGLFSWSGLPLIGLNIVKFIIIFF